MAPTREAATMKMISAYVTYQEPAYELVLVFEDEHGRRELIRRRLEAGMTSDRASAILAAGPMGVVAGREAA